MKVKQFLNLISDKKSIFACGALKDGDYVLGVISDTEKYFVPLLKKGTVGMAYVDPAKYDENVYATLTDIVNLLNETHIFTQKRYVVTYAEALGFDKTIERFIKPTNYEYSLPKKCKEAFEEAGYKVSAAATAENTYFTKREYGTVVDDNPEYKMIYETLKAQLDAKNISCEHFDTEEEEDEYQAFISGRSTGILLLGDPGTGKTTLGERFAVRAKAPYRYIQIQPDMTPADLEGQIMATGDPTCPAKFIDGPATKMLKIGGIIHIDEIDKCNNYSGIRAAINKLTDHKQVFEIGGQLIKKHPNFYVILSGNEGEKGSEALVQSTKDRVAVIQFPPLTKEQFCERLINHSKVLGHEIKPDFAGKLYQFTCYMNQTASDPKWHEAVQFGYRKAQSLLDNILSKPYTLEAFTSRIYMNYCNLLSCDNNNIAKLTAFKETTVLASYIKELYDLYDFSELEEAKSAYKNLTSLFTKSESTEEEDEDDEDEADAEARAAAVKKKWSQFN